MLWQWFLKVFLTLTHKIFYHLNIKNIKNISYNHCQTHFKYMIKYALKDI